MPRLAWRLKNRSLSSIPPLPSTSSVADITRIVLCSVYRRVTSEKDSKWSSPESSADESGDVRARTLVAHWKQHPLKNAWKESACTLRYAFSGAELACIPYKKLKELGTTRQLHLLALHYVDRRSFDGPNKPIRHVVGCEDSATLPRYRYLRGAMLAVVVHP